MVSDLDKTLAWKQSIVYAGGLILVVVSVVLMAAIGWPGILLAIAGFSLLIWNLISVINSDQIKAIKIALIIPKSIVMGFLFIIFLLFAYLGVLS